jgi:hypothetical protein
MNDVFFVEGKVRVDGRMQRYWVESCGSLDTIIGDILACQYDVSRVLKVEGGNMRTLGTGLWRDVTVDIAGQCLARLDRAADEIPDRLRDFIESHLGVSVLL